MGVFSKMSEEEIKKRQAEQDARQADLDRREADVDRRAEALADDGKRLASQWAELATQRNANEESLAEKRSEILQAEQALALREVEAKAGFVEQQREAFREAVDARARQLDARHNELDEAEQRRMAAVEAREAACAERARGLDQRDAEALERQGLLETRAQDLRKREEQLAKAEQERDGGFAESRRAFDLELRSRRQEVELQAEELRKREELVAKAELERDAGFTEIRRTLDEELHAKRKSADAELGQLRLQRLSEIQEELTEERRRRREELSRELEADRARVIAGLDEANQRQADLAAKEGDLDYRQKSLDAWEVKLNERKEALDDEVEQRVAHRQHALDAAEARLEQRKQALEEEVEEAVAERRASYEAREETLKAETNRLRGQLQSSEKLLGLFDGLKKQLGGRDAEQVLADLSAKEVALTELREKVAQVSPAMRDDFERIRADRDRLQAAVEERDAELTGLRGRMRGEEELRLELQTAEGRGKSLMTQADILEGRCNQLTEENKRLRSAYEREEDRDARIRDIEEPDLSVIDRMPLDAKVDEIDWLNGIGDACVDYGLRFHPRILKAFHTALKTAEWSPLTVLAGVSGTGKSELPRLYAHFGGMTFRSLPVQPNWDSQESMLGFFNSIDNKFDAQPVLRLLARSQRPWTEENHGLLDSVVMVLLDEMNLAHPELYFAEFLSKLELRRGCKGNVPALEVKLGAGLLPYPVPMGRNVLWTGTMNQDETTKSLSDKVLDRSIVIHFPRPATLERRRELRQLPPPSPLLSRKVWESWWTRRSDFSDEQIRPFKAVVEGVNQAMSKVGRALGHRVWQSIEYYMANYPDTLAAQRSDNQEDLRRAMRTAFEDQLVQKIMPKLRGIDTRGRSKTDCLDKVRALLAEDEYGILDDFDLSCECGYGQFIWQTVSFLQEPTPADQPVPDVTSAAVADPPAKANSGEAVGSSAEDQPASNQPGDGPPSTFRPKDPERAAKWERASPQTRKKYTERGQ